MHIEHQLVIAAQEAESATDARNVAWDRLEAAIDRSPHVAALRAAFHATRSGTDEHQVAYRALESAALVELYDEWSDNSITTAVERLARQRLAALRALAAADTYECAAGAGVAQ